VNPGTWGKKDNIPGINYIRRKGAKKRQKGRRKWDLKKGFLMYRMRGKANNVFISKRKKNAGSFLAQKGYELGK